MDNVYIRQMSKSDMSFFMDECVDAAKDGRLHKDMLSSKFYKIFEKQVREITRVNELGQYSGHTINILVRKSDEKAIGFLWLCASEDMAHRPCIEIRIINITKSMRGKGFGSYLLSVALDELRSQIVTAKCYSASTQMADMLKRKGFDVMGTSKTGAEYLYLAPKSSLRSGLFR